MKKLCILVGRDSFETSMMSLIIATGAASSGVQVDMFFTFWGFNLIRKNNRHTEENVTMMQKVFGMLNKGSTLNANLEKFNFGGAGTSIIRGLMKKKGISSPEDLLKMAKELGVKFHACDMSRGLFGIDKKDFIDGLIDDTIGVVTFLEIVKEADVTLNF